MSETPAEVPPAPKTKPLTIEQRVERFLASRKTPAQRRRLKKKFGQELGAAEHYRGAVKKARLKKLAALWLDAELPPKETS